MALYPAAVLGLTGLATSALRLPAGARVCLFAVAWSAAEWARGHFLTGLPWNLVGYAWSGGFPGSLAMLQSVAWVGIYGLSFVTVLAAALQKLRPSVAGKVEATDRVEIYKDDLGSFSADAANIAARSTSPSRTSRYARASRSTRPTTSSGPVSVPTHACKMPRPNVGRRIVRSPACVCVTGTLSIEHCLGDVQCWYQYGYELNDIQCRRAL